MTSTRRLGIFLGMILSVEFSLAGGNSPLKLCKENEYFDDVTDSCAPCREICQFAKITRSEDDCRQKCPAFSENQDNTQTQSENNLLPKFNHDKISSAGFVGICICTIVLLAVLVVGIIKRKTIIQMLGNMTSPTAEVTLLVTGNENLAVNESVAVHELNLERRESCSSLDSCDLNQFVALLLEPQQETFLGQNGGNAIAVTNSRQNIEVTAIAGSRL